MLALQRFIKGDRHGIHYAVSIFIATAVLWLLVHKLAERDPIWAISSMVASSDPLMKQAVLTFREILGEDHHIGVRWRNWKARGCVTVFNLLL